MCPRDIGRGERLLERRGISPACQICSRYPSFSPSTANPARSLNATRVDFDIARYDTDIERCGNQCCGCQNRDRRRDDRLAIQYSKIQSAESKRKGDRRRFFAENRPPSVAKPDRHTQVSSNFQEGRPGFLPTIVPPPRTNIFMRVWDGRERERK